MKIFRIRDYAAAVNTEYWQDIDDIGYFTNKEKAKEALKEHVSSYLKSNSWCTPEWSSDECTVLMGLDRLKIEECELTE